MALTAVALDTPYLSTGDYAGWRSKIFDLLESKSRSVDNRISPLHKQLLYQVLTEKRRGEEEFRDASMQAAIIICAHVRLDILQRVPTEHLMDAPRLIRSLKGIAESFRFLDLPVELRDRVYSFLPGFPTKQQHIEAAFSLRQPSTSKSAGGVKCGRRYNIMPPVSQVCATMRTEVVREIFKNRIFKFSFERCQMDLVHHVLASWVTEVGQQRFISLPGFSLTFSRNSVRGYRKSIKITIGTDDKLHLEELSGFNEIEVWKWSSGMKKHLKKVNEANTPRTSSEVLRSMLVDDPKLWEWSPWLAIEHMEFSIEGYSSDEL